MASAFKNSVLASVGTVKTALYTTPAGTSTTVIGLSVANLTVSSINVTVVLTSVGVDYHLIKNVPVPAGSSVVLFGGDQKLVTTAGQIISVQSSAATSADVVMSYLELS